MMVVFASRPMGVRFGCRRRHERLTGQDDVTGLLLLREMCGDIGVVGLHVTDQTA